MELWEPEEELPEELPEPEEELPLEEVYRRVLRSVEQELAGN